MFIQTFKTFWNRIISAQYKCGDAVPIRLLQPGTQICSFEFYPGKGAQIARSAGNSCIIQRHIEGRTVVKMPSGREINVDSNCVAVVGRVSNVDHHKEDWGTGFYRRTLGLRPSYGINLKGRKDGRRSCFKSLPPHPTVHIGDKLKLQHSSSSFDEWTPDSLL